MRSRMKKKIEVITDKYLKCNQYFLEEIKNFVKDVSTFKKKKRKFQKS